MTSGTRLWPAIPTPRAVPPPTRRPGGSSRSSGERDQAGYLRLKDPNSPNVGFGSRPFFDIGAFEFRQLFPPHVTAVSAAIPGGAAPVNFYKVGGVSGANVTPNQILIQFDKQLDPNTINAQTVLLQASGGDGIFGNGNNANDKFISLAGKLSFDSATNTMIINLGGSGLSLADDAYRIWLLGNGSNVIRDPQGATLDGENTDPKSKDDPNNPQLPLPSGDGFPGGNFYNTFVINSTPLVGQAGHVPALAVERHQYRGRLRHLLVAAELPWGRSSSPTRPWYLWRARPRSWTSAWPIPPPVRSTSPTRKTSRPRTCRSFARTPALA